MKIQTRPLPVTFHPLRWLCALAVAAVLVGSAHAGESFANFITGCGMGETDQNMYDGFPYNGVPGSNPYPTLASHGVNYVRLEVLTNPGGLPDMANTSPPTWDNEFELLKEAKLAHAAGLKLEIDFIYSDQVQDLTSTLPDGTPGQSGPASWLVNGQVPTNAEIYVDVYNFTKKVLTDLKGALGGSTADIVKLGNEINHGVCWTTSRTYAYYQVLYNGAKAAKDVDPNIGVLIHFAGTSGSGILNDCSAVVNAQLGSGGIPSAIPFDAFGFSAEPMGESISQIQSDFFDSNLGQFGKALIVQENGFAFTGTEETFNGSTWPINYTSEIQKNGSPWVQTGYSMNAFDAHRYMMDVMTAIGSTTHGKGCFSWAGDDIAGWGRNPSPGDYNFAFWDSATGLLVTTNAGVTVLSAYNHSY